jgi:hypothetical protein
MARRRFALTGLLLGAIAVTGGAGSTWAQATPMDQIWKQRKKITVAEKKAAAEARKKLQADIAARKAAQQQPAGPEQQKAPARDR